MKRKQLRWRREPRATGLAAVCQGTRGWELRYGGESVADVRVYHKWGGSRFLDTPWYWCACNSGLGVPLKNTSSNRVGYETADEAKAACRAYVVEHLVRS